jgi:hypothetical protein
VRSGQELSLKGRIREKKSQRRNDHSIRTVWSLFCYQKFSNSLGLWEFSCPSFTIPDLWIILFHFFNILDQFSFVQLWPKFCIFWKELVPSQPELTSGVKKPISHPKIFIWAFKLDIFSNCQPGLTQSTIWAAFFLRERYSYAFSLNGPHLYLNSTKSILKSN